MDNIFRSFFGFPRKPNVKLNDEDAAGYNEEYSNGFYQQDHSHFNEEPFQFSFGFGHPDDIFRHSEDMFRHFDDMFRSFDEAFQSMGQAEFSFQDSGNFFRNPSVEAVKPRQSLRDFVLKVPDSHTGDINTDTALTPYKKVDLESPSSDTEKVLERAPGSSWFGRWWRTPAIQPDKNNMSKMDVDLDNEVSKRGLESLYFNGITDHNHESHPTLHTRSVFVRSYRGADGRIEETRKVIDEHGVEETTVTKTVDGQSHTVTTRTEPKGGVSVSDSLNEKEQRNFYSRWGSDNLQEGKNQSQRFLGRFFGEDTKLDNKKDTIFDRLFVNSFKGFYTEEK